jgi:class 3 adenylate cyclase/tetratricopeptide (TPR) repeat protein
MGAAMRKTVTVVFCDLADSTELGERLDPETLRGLMTRWFSAMQAPVEQHGGTVEKFIGDAVMAVFGVPQLHEDDALRAVRAAVEMQAALARLNGELAGESRPQLHVRIGVNSGEVVTGDASTTLVTGDTVNTAKRLEEAARAGEILIGATTRRLVENAAQLEPAQTVPAKGKREPVEAWRVASITPGATPFARRLDAPLVGRTHELAFLRGELAAAERKRACRLVTVFGAAGIGKSRLAAELQVEVRARATVLSARCLPYGDGITFLPLTELVRSAGGADAVARAVQTEPDGELIAERIRGAIGASPVPASSEETFWAIRRLLETLARTQTLVVCIEDLHWAQPTFFDLLEYVAAWSRDAPMLLLCLARPELLDDRPRWGGAALALDPLTGSESKALLDELAAEWPVSAAARVRITEAAEGNPLFVEQMVAMLAEGETDDVPATIQAVLAARLDRLEPLERAVLERAAIVGKEFWPGAVKELSPAEEQAAIGAALFSLVRKELVRPEQSALIGEDAFRFRHALIRDAAYAEIPKSVRAELHERFAGWLERSGGGDELVGYHLEQAFRYRSELGIAVDASLAERASGLLGSAGQLAAARDDMPAARNLLERALELGQLPGRRAELLRDLAGARWATGDVAGAAAVLDEAIETAAREGDLRQEWYGRLERAGRRRTTRASDDDLVEVATEAVAVFRSLADDLGLARAWRRLALVSFTSCRYAEAATQAERALEHARLAGDASEQARSTDTLCSALLYGPEPAAAAAARCRALLPPTGTNPVLEAAVRSALAGLEAMQGAFAEARDEARRAAAIYDELGLRLLRAGLAEVTASVERLAGDLEAAERELRLARDVFVEAGSAPLAGLQSAALAEVALDQGRLHDAEVLLTVAQDTVHESDPGSFAAVRRAAARVAAARGEREEALRLANEAVEALAETDALALRADALAVRAVVAGEVPTEALELYARKGNVAAAERLAETASRR